MRFTTLAAVILFGLMGCGGGGSATETQPTPQQLKSQTIPYIRLADIREEFRMVQIDGVPHLWIGLGGDIATREQPSDPRPQLWRWESGSWREVLGPASPSVGWVNDVIVWDVNQDGREDLVLIDHGREVRTSQGLYLTSPLRAILQGTPTWTMTSLGPHSFYHQASKPYMSQGQSLLPVPRLGLGSSPGLSALAIFNNQGQDVSRQVLPVSVSDPGTLEGFSSATVLELGTHRDLIVTDPRNILVLRQQGTDPNWSLVQTIPYHSQGRVGSTLVSDFNRDGVEDILLIVESDMILGSSQQSTRVIILSSSNGVYRDMTLHVLGTDTLTRPFDRSNYNGISRDTVQHVDINQDGVKDIVWLPSWGTIQDLRAGIWLGTNQGYRRLLSQEAVWLTLDPTQRFRPTFHDLDQDGLVDLILVREGTTSSEIVWLRQQ